jgi:predicted DNA-binding transcriptional regulator AlpA
MFAMTEFTFNELPKAVTQLYDKLTNIERILLEKSNVPQPQSDRWFDLNELVEYDPEKRTKPTFYGYVGDESIPFHKRGKKLIFLKSEIDAWLRAGRRRTFSETASEAVEYLKKSNLR